MSQLKYDKMSASERKEYLLRVLGFLPVTISKIRDGEILLGDALADRINEVINNPADTTQCAIVCQNIRRDGVSYETLDATPYLEHINELKARGGRFADDEPVNSGAATFIGASGQVSSSPYEQSQDGQNRYGQNQYGQNQYGQNRYGQAQYGQGTYAQAGAISGAVFPRPILRYAARFVDQMVGKFAINLLFIFVLHVSPVGLAITSYASVAGSKNSVLVSMYSILSIAAIYIFEPLFIHLWGTTPGKKLFGIYITNPDGSKLSIGQAFRRSILLLVFGCGLHLPILRVFTLFSSYNKCKRGIVLRWDTGIAIRYPESVTKKNVVPAVLLAIGMGLATVFCISLGNLAPNRGNITENEFYENCKHVVRYESITFDEIPDYVVTTDASGYVKSVSFTVESENEEKIYEYYNQMYVAFMAFVGAQNEMTLSTITGITGTGITTLFSNCFADISTDFAGIHVSNEVDTVGYEKSVSGYLYPSGNVEVHTYKQVFTLSK